MSELYAVLGASGGLGGAVVRALAGRGAHVRAVTRGGDAPVPDGVERLAADVGTADGAAAACAGASVVVHAAQPPYWAWPERFPSLNRAVIAAAQGAGAKLVFADNLYMYGPASGPLSETSPLGAADAKGRVRIALAEELLAAHREGRIRVAIGRMSDYYGPAGLGSTVAALMFAPAARGKAMRWIASLDQPHTFAFLPDAARGLVTLADDARADGEVWHVPAAPAITARELGELINRRLPKRVRVSAMSARTLRLGGLFNRMARETAGIVHQFDRPFISDTTKFEATFGPLPTTPHAAAVEETLAWFRDHAR